MAEAFLATAGLPDPSKTFGNGGNASSHKHTRGFVGADTGVDLTPCLDLCQRVARTTVFGAAVKMKASLAITAPISVTSTDQELTDDMKRLLVQYWTPFTRDAVWWIEVAGFVPIAFRSVGTHTVPVVAQQGAYVYRMFHDSDGQPYIRAFHDRKMSAAAALASAASDYASIQAIISGRNPIQADTSGLQSGMPGLRYGPDSAAAMSEAAANIFVHIVRPPTINGTLDSAAMAIVPSVYFFEGARRHHMLANSYGAMPPVYTQTVQTNSVASQLGSAMLGGDSVTARHTQRTAMRQAGGTGIVADTATHHIAKVAQSSIELGGITMNVPVSNDYYAPPVQVSRGTFASRIIPVPMNQTIAGGRGSQFHGDVNAMNKNLAHLVALHLQLPPEMLLPSQGRHSAESTSKGLLRRTLRGMRRMLEGMLTFLFNSLYKEQMRRTAADSFARRYEICTSAVRRYMEELDVRVLSRTATEVLDHIRDVKKSAGDTGGDGAGAGGSKALQGIGSETPPEAAARDSLTTFLLQSNGHNALGVAIAQQSYIRMMNSLAASPVLENLSKDQRYKMELATILAKSMKNAARKSHFMARSKLLPGLLKGANMNAPDVLVGRPVDNPLMPSAPTKKRKRASDAQFKQSMSTEDFARHEADMAMDAQEIAVFSDPVSGMPFQPVGYTAKRITIQDRARERLGDAEKLAASMKQRGNSTAEIQRTLRETVKSISAIMQAELMDALQTAAKAPLSNMLENLKATAAIHDTDPAANIFTLFEAGILTPDALSKRVAHQTGFDPEELEGTLPMEVLAKRNGNTMKHIMKTFDVDQNTALTLMGMRSGGGGGGAGAGARGEPSSLGTSDEDASMSDREHQDKAQAGMDDVAMPTPKGQKGTKQKQAQRGTEEGDSQLDE